METCKSCRHWRPGHHGDWIRKGAGACNNPGIHDQDWKLGDAEMAYGCDEGCGFFTGPDFGCVLWDPKEPSDG